MSDAVRADALLADLPREGRGRLKVFLGAAPGVGKTFAMLQAAHGQLRQGIDLRAGVVETHGRAETEALLIGLPQQALKRLEYRGVPMVEMDLDALLQSPPALVLVDELAHSNVPGSRHAKRWQDVQELLEAGIDVYTTVNVQHLESLNDRVQDITGVQVRETVPDWVLQEAYEIQLVDLPPRELLERLRDGKVYVPEQARAAIDAFFSQTNLTALRELAMQTALRGWTLTSTVAIACRARLRLLCWAGCCWASRGMCMLSAWFAMPVEWLSAAICRGRWYTWIPAGHRRGRPCPSAGRSATGRTPGRRGRPPCVAIRWRRRCWSTHVSGVPA